MELNINQSGERLTTADYDRMQQDSVAQDAPPVKAPVFTHSLRTEALVILDLGLQRFAAELARAVPSVKDSYGAIAEISLSANRLDFADPFAARTSYGAGFATEVLDSLSKTLKSFNRFDNTLVAGDYNESVATMREAVNDSTRELARRFDSNLRPVYSYESESGPIERYNVAESLVTFVPIFNADVPAAGQVGGHLEHSAVICAVIAYPMLLLSDKGFAPNKIELIRSHIVRTMADGHDIKADEVGFAVIGSSWEMYSPAYESSMAVVDALITANYRGAAARYVYVPRSIINSQVSACDPLASSLQSATFEIFNALDADPTASRGGDSPLDFMLLRLNEDSAVQSEPAGDVADTSAKDLDFGDDLAEEDEVFGADDNTSDDDLMEEDETSGGKIKPRALSHGEEESDEDEDEDEDEEDEAVSEAQHVVDEINAGLAELQESGFDLTVAYREVRRLLNSLEFPASALEDEDGKYVEVVSAVTSVRAATTTGEYARAFNSLQTALEALEDSSDSQGELQGALIDALEPYLDQLTSNGLESVRAGDVKSALRGALEQVGVTEDEEQLAALAESVLEAKTRSSYDSALESLLDALFDDEGDDSEDEEEEEDVEFDLDPESRAHAFGAIIGYLDLSTPQLAEGETLTQSDEAEFAAMRDEAYGELRSLLDGYDGDSGGDDEEFNRALLLLGDSITPEMIEGAVDNKAARALLVRQVSSCLESTDLFDYVCSCGSNVLAGYESMIEDDEDEDAEESDED